MSRHIPDIRAIRSFVPFVILYADFITNFTNVPNATNFNRLFSGKPLTNDPASNYIFWRPVFRGHVPQIIRIPAWRPLDIC
ncbi:MAG: hypothetical protein EF813_02525 [Methanosarcinales archaeon]|nr:MAG: hypothetical protein EF813_02525 [Methanosarcinales archaeon]